MDIYLWIKTIHIISAAILFGTGIGIAFFMFMSHFTDNVQQKLYAVRHTVIADYCFTLPAVILQPVTGFWLLWQGGYDITELWLVLTYALYVLAGICWLPVVYIQIHLKKMVVYAIENNRPLSQKYHRWFKIWFILGWPAFMGLVIIFFLMVAKPV